MSNLFGMGGGRTAATTSTQALGIDLQGAQYGPPIPVGYGQNKVSGNVIDYWGFKSIAHTQSVGKGGSQSSTSYTYQASYLNGLCEGPITGIVQVWSGTSVVLLSTLAPFSATGTVGQAAWSQLPSGHQLGYSGTALFGVSDMALGGSATLPNYNYEIQWPTQYGSGILDANPSVILNDLCTNAQYGLSFNFLGSLTQYSNYCVANGLFLSPVYEQQGTGVQILTDLFKATNTYAYFSEGVLKVVPLGDVAVTGNGVTYTPNVTPVVNLGAADFIVSGNESPVTVQRKAPQDCYNAISLQFEDRANTYHNSAVVASIDEDMIANGARMAQTANINGCTTAAVARFIAQNMVQRAYYVRNHYRFKLSWRYCYLEPTDIVTLTDVNTGLNLFPVRILEVAEDGDGLLDLTAEEFPEGIGHSALYGTQAGGQTPVDPNSDPGPVNAPYLFRAPGYLVGGANPEVWCAVCGSGVLWGGCDVYLSHDGSSYSYLGTINKPARYGVTTSSFPPAPADPDTTTVLGVNLYAPAALNGATQADADNLNTLAMVGAELIAYETATLTGTEAYNLSYLRRNAYGTTNGAGITMAAGAPFVRIDAAIFRIPVDPSSIGQTVYLKFLSLNSFGKTPRTLASETAYTYVIGSSIELPDVPPVPSSFAATAVADGVNLTWTNSVPAAVSEVVIYRSTLPTSGFTELASVGPTTTFYTDHFTSGAAYYYYLIARGPLISSGYSAATATISSAGKTVADGATVGATIGPGGNVNGAVDVNGRPLIDFTQGGHLGKSLANVPDDATSSRYAVLGVDVNRRPLIDFTQTTHVGKVLDNIGDGSTYGRPLLSRLSAGNPLIDFSATYHLNKNLDNIADTGSYLRSSAFQGTAGALQIDNAQCALPANADGSLPGWNAGSLTTGARWVVETSAPDAGYAQDYGLETPTAASAIVDSTRTWACLPGDVVSITARVNASSGLYSGVLIVFFNSAGTSVGNVNAAGSTTGWQTYTASGAAPANTAYIVLRAYCGAPASGNGFVSIQWIRASINDVRVPNSAKAYIDFGDAISGGHVGKVLDNIGDGSTYARLAALDSTPVGGVNRIKLGVAGSGATLGDKRNLPQSAVNNISSYYSTNSLTWTATLSSGVYTGSINSAAFNAQYDGNSISYNASTVNLSYTGTGGTVQYWVYFDDPNHAGGTPALVATTTQSDCFASTGRVYLGSVSVLWPSGAGQNTGGYTLTGSKWSRTLMTAN